MKDIDKLFGMNAGKVWRALDSSGPLSKIQLMNLTKLSENELFQAIGWLARENKIKKEGEFYLLDQTNLSANVEKNADQIWSLFENGKINIFKLKNITKMNEETYNLALGWLSREGKLENDIISNISESISDNFEINNLKDDINSLCTDLETRDLIIKKLTDLLSLNQCNFIENKQKYEKFKIEINQKNNRILKQKNEINTKKLRIEDLKIELNNLNSDIETRNVIIRQITDQLNMKQTQFIENSNFIQKLKSELNQNKNLIKSANKKLNDRINIISSLQEELKNEKRETNISNSTLFSKPDSLINNKENLVNNENDIQEALREKLLCESDEIDHSTLKNRKNQTED